MYRREFAYDNSQSNGDVNKTLQREIKLAQNIQMKLLNGDKPKIESGEVSGVSIPARLIGGDYYDFYLLPNGKLRIVIGDVMGKGIPAAMLMILTRGAFRSASESTKGPGETLTAMNKALYADLRALGSFVTVLCAEWDPETDTLTYANAGHSLPIVIENDGDLREIPKVKGVMLGGLPESQYNENAIHLGEESLAYFYTDGITEAVNKDGDMYKMERLQDTLIQYYSLQVNEIEESVVQALDDFTEGVPQKDDITMVLLKISNGKTDITSYNSPILN
ncbi:PP2C family protein-serine/threonine phosphatase [Oceanobacillus salinisoli]|uniref:PP2C family protein-serine/threonine phosphatase n=1 Tax=Oceanobacillus salinisoli TaxID=2678611 RepID=UPI0012E16AE7|nr:PP2C family protein-serine/threonine phosphatase [Oceanobacillus salinisoli]